MSPRRKASTKILGVIEPSRAEEFLLDLANTNTITATVLTADQLSMDLARQFSRRYPEFFQPLRNDPKYWAETLTWVQFCLKRAWRAPDDLYRQWCAFEMRRFYRDALVEGSFAASKAESPILFSATAQLGIDPVDVDPRLIEPPPRTPFEAVVVYFQDHIRDRAKYCGHSDCAHPYFIAKKRWQKFCSEACAGPANREAKRKWWHENKGDTQ